MLVIMRIRIRIINMFVDFWGGQMWIDKQHDQQLRQVSTYILQILTHKDTIILMVMVQLVENAPNQLMGINCE